MKSPLSLPAWLNEPETKECCTSVVIRALNSCQGQIYLPKKLYACYGVRVRYFQVTNTKNTDVGSGAGFILFLNSNMLGANCVDNVFFLNDQPIQAATTNSTTSVLGIRATSSTLETTMASGELSSQHNPFIPFRSSTDIDHFDWYVSSWVSSVVVPNNPSVTEAVLEFYQRPLIRGTTQGYVNF